MSAFVPSMRSTFRSLLRSRAFTLTVLLTLTLALAEVIVVGTVTDRVLLRPLPFTNPGRLMLLLEQSRQGDVRLASYPTFLDLQRASGDIAELGYARANAVILPTPDGAERLAVGYVTPGFLRVLGARLVLGRFFTADEEAIGGGNAVVLSHELWQHTFGGDPSIVGRTITLDSTTVKVVGVMPPGATYPTWADLWRPIGAIVDVDPSLKNHNLHSDSRVIARIRPDMTEAMARTQLRTIQSRLAAADPADLKGWTSIQMMPLRTEIIGDITPQLVVLTGAVLLVWLLVCVNIANLVLARGVTRTREFAIRSALGAGRGRLARQVLLDSTGLALVAGVLGVQLANWAVHLIRTAPPPGLPRVTELALDGRLIAGALILTVVTGVLCGLVPAWRAGADTSFDTLREGRLPWAGGRRGLRMRSALTVGQTSLALMLLIGAGLLMQSLRRLNAIDLGFNPDHLARFYVAPPENKHATPQQQAALYRRLLTTISAVPGVQSAAVANTPPFGGGAFTHIVLPHQSPSSAGENSALYLSVSADYLQTMGLHLLRGRWFTEDDMATAGDGVVINETVAKRYWPNENPIGQPLTIFRAMQLGPHFGEPLPSVVIGVVADTKHFSVTEAALPKVYVPYTREVWPSIALVVRTTGDPQAVIPALQRAMLSVVPEVPVRGASGSTGFGTMSRSIAAALAPRRDLAWLVATFAASALLLAVLGIYGLTAYSVSQRTPEIGVRMALGASPRDVVSLVVSQGIRLALVGAVVGVGGAFALTRLLRSVLYGTSPMDALTFIGAALLLFATAIIASLLPALRAARLDPTLAIRSEP